MMYMLQNFHRRLVSGPQRSVDKAQMDSSSAGRTQEIWLYTSSAQPQDPVDAHLWVFCRAVIHVEGGTNMTISNFEWSDNYGGFRLSCLVHHRRRQR